MRKVALLLSAVVAFPMAAHAKDAFRTLHEFQRSDGDKPTWLLHKTDGTAYGVTTLGGDGQQTGLGVLYRIAANGDFSLVHAFTDSPDGAIPNRLFQASNGTIYGLTAAGGTHSGGTVFTIDGAGNYQLIHSFDPASDGAGPSWLVERPDGSFYGTASDQGVAAACPLHHANGTLFRMTQAGAVTPMHTFCENVDGSQPVSVTIAADGNLYGACHQDGPLDGDNSNGAGTFWRATAEGKVKRLHTFGPQMLNGNQPTGPNGVVQASDGFFYGTANGGGGFSNGAIFRASAAGHVVTLTPFDAFATTGRDPESNFVLASDGYFYGTASDGGLPIEDSGRSGTVYRADTKGHVWVLHSFSTEDGMRAAAPPARDDAANTLTVTATDGGAHFDGTVGAIDTAKALPVARLSFADDTVVSGQSTTGTVRLRKPAPAGGQAVTLFASNADVPASVTVPAGERSVDFAVSTTAIGFRFVSTVTASVGALGTASPLTLLPSQ